MAKYSKTYLKVLKDKKKLLLLQYVIALRWKRLRLATSEMGWLIFYT